MMPKHVLSTPFLPTNGQTSIKKNSAVQIEPPEAQQEEHDQDDEENACEGCKRQKGLFEDAEDG